MYKVDITPEGLGHLNQLPDKVREAALESIVGPIAENPPRLDSHFWVSSKDSG